MREVENGKVKFEQDVARSPLSKALQLLEGAVTSDPDLKEAREELSEYSDSYKDIRRATPEDAGHNGDVFPKENELRDIVVDLDKPVDQSVMMYAAVEAGHTPVLDPNWNGSTGTVFINGWRIDEDDDLVSLAGRHKNRDELHESPFLMRGGTDGDNGYNAVSERTEVMKKYFEAENEFQDGPVPLPEVMEVSLPYKPEKLDVPTYDAHNPKDAEIELSHLDCHLPLTEEPTNYPVPTSTVRGNPRREDTDYRAVIRDEKDFAKVSRYLEEEHPGKMASP
jgi:hypothetical protein